MDDVEVTQTHRVNKKATFTLDRSKYNIPEDTILNILIDSSPLFIGTWGCNRGDPKITFTWIEYPPNE